MPYTNFECVHCCEDKFEKLPRWIGDCQSARICDACAHDCVAPRFQPAIEHEYQYPPIWGKERLDICTFWDLSHDGFRKAWQEKEKEYAMPVKRRLCCEHRDPGSGTVCGQFLGQRGFGSEVCERCQCYTCGDCGATNDDAISTRSHACEKVKKVDASRGLQKGRHFQKCPGCEKEIFLAEGCNHMACRPPCGTHFCFVCGESVAAHQSEHWQQGGCPRFGVSGPRRIWDDPGEHSADEGDGSDGDEDDERDLLELARDERRVTQLVNTFAGALAFERSRRMLGAVATVDGDRRVALYSDLLANLDIVRQMVQTRFDVNQIPQQLRESNARHARIRNTYELSRNDPTWHTSSVTRLADLGDDAYFVFALESITDMNVIAAARGRTL